MLSQGSLEVAMVIFPRLLAELPAACLFTALFMFTLVLMAVNTQMVNVEVTVTTLTDRYPILRPHRSFVVGFVCVLLFLIGILLCGQVNYLSA